MKKRYTELFTYVLFTEEDLDPNTNVKAQINEFKASNLYDENGYSFMSDTIDWYYSDEKGNKVTKSESRADWDRYGNPSYRVYFSRIIISKLPNKTTTLDKEFEIEDWTTTNDYIITDDECSDYNEQELFDDMLDYTLSEIKDMLVYGSNNVLSDIVESYQKHGGFQDNELMNKVEKEIMRRLR